MNLQNRIWGLADKLKTIAMTVSDRKAIEDIVKGIEAEADILQLALDFDANGSSPRELIGLNERCRDCGLFLLFASRQIGDGLCHACAHKRLAGRVAGGRLAREDRKED
jgi:hypothetical protein